MAMVIIAVALLGLLEGYRAATEANARYDRNANLHLLMGQKICEMSESGQFKVGKDEGVFPQNSDVHWEAVTAETDVPNLYIIDLELFHFSDTGRVSVFLREKKRQ